MRCTGACCRDIRLWHDGHRATRAQLRHLATRDADGEKALIWLVLKPDGETDEGQERFQCRALTSTGCALTHEQRPAMCRDFPYNNGRACEHCGARTDAAARSVELMVI